MAPEVAGGPKVALKFDAPCEAVTVYPVIGDPPSEAGASHVTLTLPSPAVAVTFWGAAGLPNWSLRRSVSRSPGLIVIGSPAGPPSRENVIVEGPNSIGQKWPCTSEMSSRALAFASTPGASTAGFFATAW